MKTQNHTRTSIARPLAATVLLAALFTLLAAPAAFAATTFTWTGTSSSTYDTAGNWTPTGGPPSGVNGDTAQWNGTQAGNLSLTFAGTANVAAPGIIVSVLAGQTGTLSIDGASATGFRVGDLTLASGSGAFTLGNGTGTAGTATGFAVSLNGPTTTETWANNSANTATINSDVGLASGGGSGRTVTLSGKWTMHNSLNRTGTGSISYSLASGTWNYDGASALANTHLIKIGSTASSTAVMNITGGSITGGDQDIDAGTAGFGTINMSAGTVTPGHYLVAGVTTSGAIGIWNISGGAVSTTGNNGGTLGATAGTTGLLNMTGTGSYTSTDATANGASGIYVGENGTGTLSVSGTATMSLGGASTSVGLMLARLSGSTGVVNLGAVGSGGGTITATRVAMGSGLSSYFNFHGGTLKASSAATNNFFTGLTGAYVWSEGGTIDNNGTSITIGQPLLAPAGSGENNNPTVTAGSGYITAPYVTVNRGSGDTTGVGATAVATVSGGAITAVTMTSPGVNYTATPTFTLTGGAGSGGAVTGVAVTANTSGGLTFQGSGTTTLTATNTYTGTTTVSAGRLVVNATPGLTGSTIVRDNASLGVTVVGGNQWSPSALTLGNSAGPTTLEFNSMSASNLVGSGVASLNPVSVTRNGNVSVKINSGAFITSSNYYLMSSVPGGVTNGFSLTSPPPGVSGHLDVNGSTLVFVVDSVADIWAGITNGVATGNWDNGVTTNWVGNALLNTPAGAFLNGDSVLFDDTVTGTSNVVVATQVTPGAIVVNNSTKPYTIASSGANFIGGSAALTKSGSGTVILSGGVNTNTGVLTINAGTVSVASLANGGSPSDIGSSANSAANIVLNGGTLQYVGAGVTSDRLFTLSVSGGTVDASGTGVLNLNNSGTAGLSGTGTRSLTLTGTNAAANTLSAVIGDSGGATSLTKSGTGMWVLPSANTYTGGTTINAGIINAQNNNSLGTSGTVTSVSRSGGIQLQGNISLPSGVNFITSNDGTVAPVTNVIESLSGNNTINGTISLTSGGGSSIVQSDSGALTLAGAIRPVLNTGARTLILQGASTAANTVSGVLQNNTGASDALSVTKTGTGTWTFSGPNTHTGGTTVNAGTLALSGGSATLGAATNALTVIGGTLDLGSLTSPTAGAVAIGGGTIQNGTLTASISYAATNTIPATVSASLAGSVTLAKSGTGTLTLSGANAYGNTTINAGIIIAQHNNAFGTSGTVTAVNRAGGIQLQGNISTPAGVNFTLSNDGTVAPVTNAVQNISGDNTINGTITMTSGGGFPNIQSDSGSLTLAGTVTSDQTRALILQGISTGANNVSGIIQNGTSGANSVTKNGSGTWKLSNANTYTGGATIGAGVLVANNATALGTSGTITLSGGTLQYGPGIATDYSSRFNTAASQQYKIDVNGNNVAYAANLTSSGGTLTLSDSSGGGSLTLSGANTFAGATAVNGGKLIYSTAGSGASSATVAGGAAIGVLVAAANGQRVSSSDVTLNNNSELDVDSASFDPSTTTAPLKVNNLNLGSSLTLRVKGSGNYAVGSYPLVTWTSSGPADASAFTTLVMPTIRVLGNLSVSGNTLYLNVTANTGPLSWNIGDGTWETSSANWVDATLAAATYQDPLDAVVFDDASGVTGNPVVTLTNSLSPVSVTVNSAAHNYAFTGSGGIAGSGPLTVQNGTLTLATANSYSGGTTVSGGTLQISGSGTLGAAAGSLTVSGGTLNLGGTAQTNGGVTIGNTTIQNGTLSGTSFAATNSTAATVGAALTGAGTLTKTGNGTLTLTAANTFTGNLFGKAGAIVLDSGSMNNGGNYTSIGQSGSDVAALTLKGTASFTNTADFNVGDTGSSSGTLNIQDSAVVSVQSLFIGSANAAGSTASGTINLNGGTLIEKSSAVGNFVVGGRNSAATGGVGVINLTNGTIITACGVRVGDFGTGTVNQYGGLLDATLTGVNLHRESTVTSFGTYNLNGGTLRTLNVTASTVGVNSTFYFNGGTLQAVTAGTFVLNLLHAYVRNGGAIIDDAGFAITVSQALEHSAVGGDNAIDGGLTKLNNGTLTLTGTNTYTGNTTISAGTLALSSSGSISNSPNIRLAGGAALDVSTAASTFTLGSGQILTGLGATGLINGNLNSGAGSLVLNYTSGSPTLSETNGTFTLNNNAVTIAVQASPLPMGSYKLISAATGGAVAGLVSSSPLTVNGAGTLPSHASLSIVGGELFLIVTNQPPVANALTAPRAAGLSWKIALSNLATNWSDPDGDAISFVSVNNSTNGVTVTTNGGYVLYSNAANVNDQFSYTITDALGATSTGLVNLVISTNSTGQINSFSATGGTASMSFAGIPGYTYLVQRSTDLANWTTIQTTNAPAGGIFQFTDSSAPQPAAYYRLSWTP